MLHNVRDNYIISVKDHVSQFEEKSFRKLASNDFKSWPSSREETWRLSRLGVLSRKEITPIKPNFKKQISSVSKFKGSKIIRFVDGALREDLSSKLPPGLSLNILGEEDSLICFHKFKNSNLKNHPSTNVSFSCTPSIVKLTIEKDVKIRDLFEIIYEGGDNNLSVHPALYIELKDNSSITIIERFNHLSSLIMPLQLVELKKNASMNSLKIFNDNQQSYNLSANCTFLSKKSNYNSFSLIKGGLFTRSETHAYLKGENCNLNLNGVYLSSKNQHHDLTTAIYHDVPNCTSKQIVRGVLGGKATGVFQGKVRVAPDAQKTDGQQMSRAILLSENAIANAKPELEIYADDVICAHGATVGEIDDEQLFYLKSRGISEKNAKQILITAFLRDIINESVEKSIQNFVFEEAELALSEIISKEI